MNLRLNLAAGRPGWSTELVARHDQVRSEPRVTTHRVQLFRCALPCLLFSTAEVCALSSLSLRYVFSPSYVTWIRPSSVNNSPSSSNSDPPIHLNYTVAMSSWSAPVYPRRSRSRSPYRGYAGRPPYPDPYGGDPYRPEWDAYDRDRWAGYERERGPYDYGRRGRSRSPDDGMSFCSRQPVPSAVASRRELTPSFIRSWQKTSEVGISMGPREIRTASQVRRLRYDVRAFPPITRCTELLFSADPHRGGYSPRRSHHPSRPNPQDPHTLDYPASLKQYAEWFRYFFPQQAAEEDSLDKQAEIEAADGSKPRNGIRSKWEKYKKDFASNQVRAVSLLFRHFPSSCRRYPQCTRSLASFARHQNRSFLITETLSPLLPHLLQFNVL